MTLALPNKLRGEICAEFDGQSFTLCLTLGALAELEAAFGAGDLVSLAARFEAGRLSANDLIKIIYCGLRGSGHLMTEQEVASLKISGGLQAYVRIAAELLAATFGAEPMKDDGAIPPVPQDA
jgi:hypothetical protein